MPGDKERVQVDCVLKHETHAAYLLDYGDGQAWIPKSLCHQDEDDPSAFWIEEWKALKEGMI